MQTTVIPVVLMLHVEDMTNISEVEKAELISMFDEKDLPHIITETHYVISSDGQHDNAMIQKLFDDKIIPYLMQNGPNVKTLHIRSDGCKAQFKCAANFDWVSRQSTEGSGLLTDWSFFESCHGKVRPCPSPSPWPPLPRPPSPRPHFPPHLLPCTPTLQPHPQP